MYSVQKLKTLKIQQHSYRVSTHFTLKLKDKSTCFSVTWRSYPILASYSPQPRFVFTSFLSRTTFTTLLCHFPNTSSYLSLQFEHESAKNIQVHNAMPKKISSIISTYTFYSKIARNLQKLRNQLFNPFFNALVEVLN